MTDPLITEDANDDTDITDDGLGEPEPDAFDPAEVDEADVKEAPDEPTLEKEI